MAGAVCRDMHDPCTYKALSTGPDPCTYKGGWRGVLIESGIGESRFAMNMLRHNMDLPLIEKKALRGCEAMEFAFFRVPKASKDAERPLVGVGDLCGVTSCHPLVAGW